MVDIIGLPILHCICMHLRCTPVYVYVWDVMLSVLDTSITLLIGMIYLHGMDALS